MTKKSAIFHIGPESTTGQQCTTPTYDGSGQAVHPDVLDFGAAGWRGWRYWMAMTPYPQGNSNYENPSILVSRDGATWQVPAGLTNPIDPKPALFNSDTELLYIPGEDRLYCYYRDQGDGTFVRWSDDGVTWSTETQTGMGLAGSPTMLWDGTQYVVWSTWNNNVWAFPQRRVSSNPVTGWSANVPCTLSADPPGKILWHQDIIKDGNFYVGVFTYCDQHTSGANTVNYWATSPDGLTWTRSDSPIIPVPATGWDNKQHYRATLTPARYGRVGSGIYNVWYSACDASNEWHIGLLRNMRVRMN